MTSPSIPEHLKQLAAGYVVADLDPAEAEEFKQLLAENPELATEMNSLQEVLDDVLYTLVEVEPPPHLRSALLAAADISANRTPVLNRSPFGWGKIIGSVAALLILLLGVANYRLRQDLSLAQAVPTMLQHSQTRLFSLKGTNIAATASGSIVMDLEQQKLALVIRNLPAPVAGRVYRLWAVAGSEKIPCGQLSARAQGIVLDRLAVPSDLYDDVSGLIVTLEPSPTTPEPVGPVVMKSI